MTAETKWTGLKFEPHGLYGKKIDGEAMPFGYISQEGYGKPVFELSPIFVHPTEKLRALALQMAAAPEMAEALTPLKKIALEYFRDGARANHDDDRVIWGFDDADITVGDLRAAVSALLKAGG